MKFIEGWNKHQVKIFLSLFVVLFCFTLGGC